MHRCCCIPAGCQLNKGTQSCVVKEDDDFLEHLVLLRTVRSEAHQRARWSKPVAQEQGWLMAGLHAMGSLLGSTDLPGG